MVAADTFSSWIGKEVDVKRPEDVAFWTNRYHVSPIVLEKVVQMVGPRFKDVARFLHALRRR